MATTTKTPLLDRITTREAERFDASIREREEMIKRVTRLLADDDSEGWGRLYRAVTGS